MATPKILLWTAHQGDLLSGAINFLTNGTVSHAGFLRADGKTVHEAYLPVVRDRPLRDEERPGVRCFELEGLTEEQGVALEAHFDKAIETGVQYSVADLFRNLLRMPMPDDQHTFCSRYVFQTLFVTLPAGLWPLTRCIDDQVTPRDLLISPRLHQIPLPV